MSTFKEILDTRFGGVITRDLHKESEGAVCALELLSVKKGIEFTDDPRLVRCFDFRYINDIEVSDELRTKWMLPMLEAYEDSWDWNREKQAKVLSKIVISTVNQLIGSCAMPAEAATKCKEAKTLQEAESAAIVARRVAYCTNSPTAAENARRAANILYNNFNFNDDHIRLIPKLASSSAKSLCVSVRFRTVYEAERNNIFITACKLWLEAAKEDT